MADLKEVVREFFDWRAAAFDAQDLRRLSWSSLAAQQTRFAALVDVGPLDGCSVLDVGCGVGDLYGYLKQQGLRVSYTGCDLVTQNCLDAAGRHPDGTFLAADVLDTGESQAFDYVLASGTFTLAAENWHDAVAATLQRMFELCRRGIAANFLSAFSREQAAGFAYVEPAVILDLCRRFTTAFKLRHDYLDNDFTLYAYRR